MAARYPDTNPTRYGTKASKICVHHLHGNCKFESKTNHRDKFYHRDNAFQWQFRSDVGQMWTDLADHSNQLVEEGYCNVYYNDYQGIILASGYDTVEFETEPMTAFISSVRYEARRISTQSSVQMDKKWMQAYCIEWVWYWRGETDSWTEYSEKNVKGIKDGINSATIEQKYLDYESKQGVPSIGFTTGGQTYELDFKAMQQRNIHYGTFRAVRRRPKYVLMEDRKRISKKSSKYKRGGVDIPLTWTNPRNQSNMKLVTLTDSSSEYITIASLFWDTMDARASIRSIQRIQNLQLWGDFSRLKRRMKEKNKDSPAEQRQLFHGAKQTDCDSICRQNFDWRLSGTNVGAVYGKGSYFARDASFAHDYTPADSDGCHYVFVAQVLVGDYTNGDRSFVRPPSKDGNPHGELYDSCVDDIENPKIFVIFEKDQIYPEYLIKTL